MHIVLVAKYPLPAESTSGGVERVVEIFRRALAHRAKVTLVVPNSEAGLTCRDALGTIIYIKRTVLPQSLNYWSLASRAVGSIIEQVDPDIVHVHDLAGLAMTWTRSADRIRPQRIFTVHGVLEKDIVHARGHDLPRRLSTPVRAWMVSNIERASRSRYNRIVVINDYVLDAYPDIRMMEWTAIPNPVDRIFLEQPSARVSPQAKAQLLMVGVVERRKNIMAGIDILQHLIAGGIKARLDVIGRITDTHYRDRCQQRAVAVGVAESLTFHGAAAPSAIVEWMDRSDALLLPSKQETAPMVVAEAHCRGLPCAAPRAFGLVSMIDEGVDGVFIDVDNPASAAASVRALLQGRVDHSMICARAATKYDETEIVTRTLELYYDCSALGVTSASV